MSGEQEEFGWWDGDGQFYEVELDEEYTEKLNAQVMRRFGSGGVRPATHVSDLLYCLKKAHQQKKYPQFVEAPSKNTILTWAMGLIFEDTVAEGQIQERVAFCFKCDSAFRINSDNQLIVPAHICPWNTGEGIVSLSEGKEHVFCPVCEHQTGERLLIGTADYIFEDMCHEVKQTRKSRRQGVEGADWWIEQLITYIWLHQELTGSETANGRIVTNWLMGSYDRAKKGEKPKPPAAALDAFRVTFPQEAIDAWKVEIKRRKDIAEGEEVPEAKSLYPFECSGCSVGRAVACEGYVWKMGDSGVEVDMTEEEIKEREEANDTSLSDNEDV